MPKLVMIDEFHVTLRVPADLSEALAEGIRRVLRGNAFLRRLRRLLRAALRSYPELAKVRLALTR
jgi:hypothetical protein